MPYSPFDFGRLVMSYEYKVMGQTVTLEVDPNVIAVKFKPSTPRGLQAKAAEDAGFSAYPVRTEIPGENIVLLPALTSRAGVQGAHEGLSTLAADPSVDRAMPVFRVGENKIVPSDRILVGLASEQDLARLQAAYGLELLRQRDNEFLFRVPPRYDPLELSKEISEQSFVVYSEPDFITVGNHLPRRATTDGLISNAGLAVARQYAMAITSAKQAWNLQNGSRDIRIAILDEGVDTGHPDLTPVIAGSYDGTDGDAYQEPNAWDGHGTSCAGLAAALPSGDLGLTGAGRGCSILAVRIAYSPAPRGDWITTNEIIARSIDWSWQNGASVLSNSWGGGAPSNAVVLAFERARTQGRNGLGCVIAIAAGNSSGPVQFPATIRNVLAVSASNEFDEFKTRTSRDGETWWGSCFGPQISIAAPGVHNLTTDIRGAGGYSSTNYYDAFNGTSSATPIVAGACALVVSAQPSLREEQVRDLIVASADKVGATPYVNGRNDFFGFGRLNVLRGIQAAQGIT
jgi:thermitase